MSRLPILCECSKPNSSKHCRIACGKPRFLDNEDFDTWLELRKQKWQMLLKETEVPSDNPSRRREQTNT